MIDMCIRKIDIINYSLVDMSGFLNIGAEDVHTVEPVDENERTKKTMLSKHSFNRAFQFVFNCMFNTERRP